MAVGVVGQARAGTGFEAGTPAVGLPAELGRRQHGLGELVVDRRGETLRRHGSAGEGHVGVDEPGALRRRLEGVGVDHRSGAVAGEVSRGGVGRIGGGRPGGGRRGGDRGGGGEEKEQSPTESLHAALPTFPTVPRATRPPTFFSSTTFRQTTCRRGSSRPSRTGSPPAARSSSRQALPGSDCARRSRPGCCR